MLYSLIIGSNKKLELGIEEKLKLEDGVLESQVGAKFTFLVQPTVTADTNVRLIALTFKNMVFRQIKSLNFESPISGFVLFPLITNPKIIVREDFISYKRKDKCFFVGLVIPYEKWMKAPLSERVDLFSDNLIASLERVPVKYLLSKDKNTVTNAINRVREHLQTK